MGGSVLWVLLSGLPCWAAVTESGPELGYLLGIRVDFLVFGLTP